MKYKQKFAFTLAEVLITLVIIGVIAALTVPSLIQKTQNQETVSKLKKTYSTLSQATNQIIADEGPASNWAENNFELYKKKLIKVKECNQSNGCFTQKYVYYLNNKHKEDWHNDKVPKLILNDGVQILFGSTNNNCNDSQNGSINYCSRIWVDINGEKKPNTFGRDIFLFVLKKQGLYPAGCDAKKNICDKNSGGHSCACRVLKENAINY